ncbi:MAG: hypothetical protein WCB57_18370 [Pseudonocardiaceae bacterium]
MSQTPIYDQIRGERINADLPAAGSEPAPVAPSAEPRFPAGAAGPAVFTRPPEGGVDRAADWSWFAAADPAVQAAANATRRRNS